MLDKFKKLIPVILLALIPTIIVWIPFAFNLRSIWNIPLKQNSMATVVSNYDGPLYIVVAKTMYNLDAISQNYSLDLPNEYFAAHFPLFPLLIRAIALVTGLFSQLSSFAGYPYAMLVATILTSVFALAYFNKFIRQYTSVDNALWLTLVFAILPARWLIVRSVGSPEPLFIGSVLASIFYFQNKKYWLAGIFGALAQLTKSPGILLFVAYFMTLFAQSFKQVSIGKGHKLEHLVNWRAYPVLLIPLSLLGLFVFYSYSFNDFFAYFNSGDNIHLLFPPFQIFNYNAPWVGTFWLEEIIFIYLLGAMGVMKVVELYKKASSADSEKNAIVMWFTGIFFITILFVSHRDVMRYSLPMIPFMIAGWHKELVKNDFKIAFALVLIPTFLFAFGFISQNTMSISNWAPFL